MQTDGSHERKITATVYEKTEHDGFVFLGVGRHFADVPAFVGHLRFLAKNRVGTYVQTRNDA